MKNVNEGTKKRKSRRKGRHENEETGSRLLRAQNEEEVNISHQKAPLRLAQGNEKIDAGVRLRAQSEEEAKISQKARLRLLAPPGNHEQIDEEKQVSSTVTNPNTGSRLRAQNYDKEEFISECESSDEDSVVPGAFPVPGAFSVSGEREEQEADRDDQHDAHAIPSSSMNREPSLTIVAELAPDSRAIEEENENLRRQLGDRDNHVFVASSAEIITDESEKAAGLSGLSRILLACGVP